MARSMSHNSIGRSYTNNRGRFYGIRTRFQNAIYAIKINLLHKNIDFLNITGGLPDDDHRAHKRNFYGNYLDLESNFMFYSPFEDKSQYVPFSYVPFYKNGWKPETDNEKIISEGFQNEFKNYLSSLTNSIPEYSS